MSRALLLAAALALSARAAPLPELVTVPSVDLARYMGTWYEIAHLPNAPQKGCTDTVVHYRLRGDGGFDLANTSPRAGSSGSSPARRRSTRTPTKASSGARPRRATT